MYGKVQYNKQPYNRSSILVLLDLGDTVTMTDNDATKFAAKTLADVATMSEAMSKLVTAILADALTPTDAITKVPVKLLTLSDALLLIEWFEQRKTDQPWSNSSSSSGTWTPGSSNAGTWNQQGSGSGTWTNGSTNTGQWSS